MIALFFIVLGAGILTILTVIALIFYDESKNAKTPPSPSQSQNRG